MRVAIVGSGCSGIGALWALQTTDHEVHLFEADSRLGGHTNTVTFKGKDGNETQVDTGFIVMNTATYRQYTIVLIMVVTDDFKQTLFDSSDTLEFEPEEPKCLSECPGMLVILSGLVTP